MRTHAADGCSRESEVLDLVAIGQGPLRADADLRAHARQCASCADLAAAAGAIVELRDAMTTGVPDASLVWRRAQLRARQDAARRAGVPFTVAAALAATAVVAVGVAWLGAGGAWIGEAWSRAMALVPDMTFDVPVPSVADLAALPGMPVIGLGVGAALLVVPLAFYLARLADR